METFKIDSKTSNWNKVYNFLNKELTEYDIEKFEINKILICCEEIFVNICSYAYQKLNKKYGDVKIKIEFKDNMLVIIFVDNGIEFNPTKSNINIKEESKKTVEKKKIGGLGIYITKKNLDKVKYERKNGKNFLYVYKKIN